jgi:hypothetical protein
MHAYGMYTWRKLACEQALWIELEPAGLVNNDNKNTSVPIIIYSVVNQM